MPTNFPISSDTTASTLPNPSAADVLNSSTASLVHAVQHDNANDALRALEQKVGFSSSAPADLPPGGGVSLVSDASGKSKWASPSLNEVDNFPSSFTLTASGTFQQVAAITLPSAGMWVFHAQLGMASVGLGDTVFVAIGLNSAQSTALGSPSIGARISGTGCVSVPANQNPIYFTLGGRATQPINQVIGLFMANMSAVRGQSQLNTAVADPATFLIAYRIQ